MEHVERNYQILEKKMIDVMENALEFGNELIDRELDLGVLDALIKPIIKSFYNYWRNTDAKQGTLKQIKTTLGSAKYLCMNGNSSKDNFNKIAEQNFYKYLEGDQVYRQCKKNHKNYKKLKEIVKGAFISKIEESMILLKVQDQVEDYECLVRSAFKTKEEAYRVLVRQLNDTDECIKIIEDDLSILKIPTGKSILIRTLRKGFDETRENMINNLDTIYG